MTMTRKMPKTTMAWSLHRERGKVALAIEEHEHHKAGRVLGSGGDRYDVFVAGEVELTPVEALRLATALLNFANGNID